MAEFGFEQLLSIADIIGLGRGFERIDDIDFDWRLYLIVFGAGVIYMIYKDWRGED